MPFPARVAILPQGSSALRVESLVLPDPAPDQVVMRVLSSGICHSQLHEIHAPRSQDVVLGHEATGRVVAVGEHVRHVAAGDLALLGGIPRTIEPPARRPDPAFVIRENGRLAVSQGVFAWADHTIVDELYVVKLPEDTPTDVSCIIGCAVMTGAGAVLNTTGVRAGQSVAVYGAGGVGLCAIAAARVAGAHPIIAVDVDDEKLAAARRQGATETINASEVDPVERIRALTPSPGRFDMLGAPVAGVDYAFDCIGVPETARQILPSARNRPFGSDERSTAVLVGIPNDPIPVDGHDLFVHEKNLTGSIAGSCKPDRDVPIFLDWFRRGELDLEALITRRYTLDRINDAVDALRTGGVEGRAILVL